MKKIFFNCKNYMWIFWIEWQFWSWKTSLASYMAKKKAMETVRAIAKKIDWKNSIIISNIKFDKQIIPNSYYFEDSKILEMLRTGNAINDIERAIYWKVKTPWWLTKWPRKKFLKMYIFFDESWALKNKRQWDLCSIP